MDTCSLSTSSSVTDGPVVNYWMDTMSLSHVGVFCDGTTASGVFSRRLGALVTLEELRLSADVNFPSQSFIHED